MGVPGAYPFSSFLTNKECVLEGGGIHPHPGRNRIKTNNNHSRELCKVYGKNVNFADLHHGSIKKNLKIAYMKAYMLDS